MAPAAVVPLACEIGSSAKFTNWGEQAFFASRKDSQIDRTAEVGLGSIAGTDDGALSCELVAQASWVTNSPVKVRAATADDASSPKTHGNEPEKLLRRDKLAFVLGSANLCLIFYWLGYSKKTFYLLYTVESIILFSIRWVNFRREKKHYYMFDFCYAVNALLLAFLWIWPQCARLHKVLFAYNAGPLAWSIVVFQNSIVFHSLYEWTSLFLHWYPMLVSWTLRWDKSFCSLYSTCDASGTKWWKWISAYERWSWGDVFDLAVLPMAPYFVWAFLYYLKIFVISSKRIEQRGYETLYKYMISDNEGMCGKVMHRFPTRFQPLIYMMFHCMLCWFSMAISVFFWYFPVVHTGLILLTTGTSFWNGASHYLEATVTTGPVTPTRQATADERVKINGKMMIGGFGQDVHAEKAKDS